MISADLFAADFDTQMQILEDDVDQQNEYVLPSSEIMENAISEMKPGQEVADDVLIVTFGRDSTTEELEALDFTDQGRIHFEFGGCQELLKKYPVEYDQENVRGFSMISAAGVEHLTNTLYSESKGLK